jgi:hypothetical protein
METVQIGFWVIAGLVVVALLFDFMNGFHDAANAIATVVSTGVLKPHRLWPGRAFFNFVALFVFQLKVASTVGKGIIDPAVVDHYLIFGALLGAIAWNVMTLVLRHPVQLLPRPHRRHCRRCHCQGRYRSADLVRHLEDRLLHHHFAAVRLRAWFPDPGHRGLGVPQQDPAPGG